jgi:hypothetical protein
MTEVSVDNSPEDSKSPWSGGLLNPPVKGDTRTVNTDATLAINLLDEWRKTTPSTWALTWNMQRLSGGGCMVALNHGDGRQSNWTATSWLTAAKEAINCYGRAVLSGSDSLIRRVLTEKGQIPTASVENSFTDLEDYVPVWVKKSDLINVGTKLRTIEN